MRCLWGCPERLPHRGRHHREATDDTRPMKPPITAPLVVQSFHKTLMNSTGKLAGSRNRKGQRHHEGNVLLLEHDAQHHGHHAQRQVVMRDTRSSAALSALPLLEHGGVQVVRHGRCARQRQACHHQPEWWRKPRPR